jgi:hypothetical protein
MVGISCQHNLNDAMAESKKESTSIDESQPSQSDDLLILSQPGSRAKLLAEQKLVRKLDMRLLPVVFAIYVLNHIDVGLVCVIPQVRADISPPA